MDEVKEIVNQINTGNIKPIYFLMGEEPYYIDKISDYIEAKVLSVEEQGFNQVVLYGHDVTISAIISQAKRYPMMSKYQVVIVKEAQKLASTIEQLAAYAENPQPSTILVINYKYDSLDKRKALYKTLKKEAVVFESNTIYAEKVPDWIKRVLASQKYEIEPKAAIMLVEFLGNNLSKISNELDKLKIILPVGTLITAQHIEDNIGISKDFNNFELRSAIGARNVLKAHKIIKYFSENPKDNPIVVTITLLFSFFSQIMQYHGLLDKTPKNVAVVLKINPYFVKDYTLAAQNYPMRRVSDIIATLREFDVKSKGVGANALPQSDLLKELLSKIFM